MSGRGPADNEFLKRCIRMTACAAIFNRNGKPADERLLCAMLEEMAYRGPDGAHTCVRGEVALGLREFCVLPEDQGIEWPVWSRDKRACILFDGRLDNREEIIRLLKKEPGMTGQPDAMLVLLAYRCWGCESFAKLLGDFAFIIFEPDEKALTLVRDQLGGRRLCYTEVGDSILIASEEQALLSNPDVKLEINESSIAAYFADTDSFVGETYFRNIIDLLPGHWMRIDLKKITTQQYWRLPCTREHWNLSWGEVQEIYRAKLYSAVESRLRGITQTAVMLSGGIDSSSVLAAAVEVAQTEAQKPVAVSHVFDRFEGCDERIYLRDIYDKTGVRSIQVVCDDYWPLYSEERYTHSTINDINLDLNGTRYESDDIVRQQGIRIVLHGGYGDEQYAGYPYWLRDLFSAGRYRPAIGALYSEMASIPPGRWLRDPALRRLLPFSSIIRGRRSRKREWMTSYTLKNLPEIPEIDLMADRRRWHRERFSGCVGLSTASGYSMLHASAQHCSIDMRAPYQDRRLLEFVLNLPAYYLYDHEGRRDRPLVRDAMKSILPDSVATRRDKTKFTNFVIHGITDGAPDRVRRLLSRSDAVWPDYVEPKWLFDTLGALHSEPAGFRVLWSCICLELWMDAIRRKN